MLLNINLFIVVIIKLALNIVLHFLIPTFFCHSRPLRHSFSEASAGGLPVGRQGIQVPPSVIYYSQVKITRRNV
ncbi:hypothetical protein COZ73_02020 [Candidatus Falkowbacteria bacterium CG_4_8_14_3_um_filter_36_11]|uniref:Uncharacterized protein n=1 Tax=Candidatus Falkowbacteria bacterium CG02_land_8_20_14_3_00_36_14 TaxID=1974560 RepID=A0A2M7DN11_9BACT|nr:MAG: hypothetical protein COS18_03230 [Candidatus Falkowbacteria bacterium CG02_land_8_20_14_3_00_36_14]PIX11663.1 MAG: hypothetical protein COZ73_02020 [Candidatus Falkowbacteria bacterium CG_4_8_14_3_um_filter_36_11]